MNNFVTVDLNNKVVLNVQDYVEIINNQNKLEFEAEMSEKKYKNLVKYLLSECEVKKYTNDEKYLKYDSYNNHLGEYLKQIEPEMYAEKLEDGEKE